MNRETANSEKILDETFITIFAINKSNNYINGIVNRINVCLFPTLEGTLSISFRTDICVGMCVTI